MLSKIKNLLSITPYKNFVVEYYGKNKKRIMVAKYSDVPYWVYKGRTVSTATYGNMLFKINLDTNEVQWGRKYPYDHGLYKNVKELLQGYRNRTRNWADI